jgi:hypothetical protein
MIPILGFMVHLSVAGRCRSDDHIGLETHAGADRAERMDRWHA